MNKIFLSISLLFLASAVQAGALYRSIDENGNVHYSDKPVPNAVDTEKLNSMFEPSQDDSLPFEVRRASSKFPVTLFVADSCGSVCSEAREYLKKRGIPFSEKKLITQQEIDAFKKASGGDQVPVMHIGNDWINGYLEVVWSQALDTAGYPKNAPYIPKTTPTEVIPKN